MLHVSRANAMSSGEGTYLDPAYVRTTTLTPISLSEAALGPAGSVAAVAVVELAWLGARVRTADVLAFPFGLTFSALAVIDRLSPVPVVRVVTRWSALTRWRRQTAVAGLTVLALTLCGVLSTISFVGVDVAGVRATIAVAIAAAVVASGTFALCVVLEPAHVLFECGTSIFIALHKLVLFGAFYARADVVPCITKLDRRFQVLDDMTEVVDCASLVASSITFSVLLAFQLLLMQALEDGFQEATVDRSGALVILQDTVNVAEAVLRAQLELLILYDGQLTFSEMASRSPTWRTSSTTWRRSDVSRSNSSTTSQ